MVTVVFGVSTISRTQVQLRYNYFKVGREDGNDAAHSGCPSTSTADENVEAVKTMLLDNRRITIRKIAEDVAISFGLCQAIFTDIVGMKCVAANIVL